MLGDEERAIGGDGGQRDLDQMVGGSSGDDQDGGR